MVCSDQFCQGFFIEAYIYRLHSGSPLTEVRHLCYLHASPTLTCHTPGLRLAEKRSLPCPHRNEWITARDELYEQIMHKAWNKDLQIFGQSYEETDVLDSSVMIMPLVFFMNPSDPRFLSTLKAVLKSPERGGLTSNVAFSRCLIQLLWLTMSLSRASCIDTMSQRPTMALVVKRAPSVCVPCGACGIHSSHT